MTTKPMTKERALGYLEDMVDMAMRREFQSVRFIQMRELCEVKALLGDIKDDLRMLNNVREELERLKRNVGQLGSEDTN